MQLLFGKVAGDNHPDHGFIVAPAGNPDAERFVRGGNVPESFEEGVDILLQFAQFCSLACFYVNLCFSPVSIGVELLDSIEGFECVFYRNEDLPLNVGWGGAGIAFGNIDRSPLLIRLHLQGDSEKRDINPTQ